MTEKTEVTPIENEAIAFALRLVLGNHTMVDAAIKMAQSAWKGRNIGQPK